MTVEMDQQEVSSDDEFYNATTEESSSDEEGGLAVGDELMINLKAVTPSDDNIPAITALMKQIFKHTPVPPGPLAKLVVATNYVTSIYVTEDDDEDSNEMTILAVFSVVNIKTYKNHESIYAFHNMVLELCDVEGAREGNLIKEILDVGEGSVYRPGFLILEKILNVPEKSLPAAVNCLMDDMTVACNNGMQYDFTHFVYVVKMFRKDDGLEVFDQDVDGVLFDILLQSFNKKFGAVNYNYPASIDCTAKVDGVKVKQYRKILVFPKAAFNMWYNRMLEFPGVQEASQENGLVLNPVA